MNSDFAQNRWDSNGIVDPSQAQYLSDPQCFISWIEAHGAYDLEMLMWAQRNCPNDVRALEYVSQLVDPLVKALRSESGDIDSETAFVELTGGFDYA